MAFGDILKDIVTNIQGGLAAMVMGVDGIPVDSYTTPTFSYDIQVLGVESATVMREIRRAAEALRSGALKELSFMTEGATVVLRSLTDEYFVALVLLPNGNFGKGRYLLKRSVPKLMAEF